MPRSCSTDTDCIRRFGRRKSKQGTQRYRGCCLTTRLRDLQCRSLRTTGSDPTQATRGSCGESVRWGAKYRLWRTFTCRQGIIPRGWPPVPWDFPPLVPGSPVEAAQIGIKRSPEATLWYVVGNSRTTRYTLSVRKGARCLCELCAICLADFVDGAVHAQVAFLNPDRALADALDLVHGVAHEQDGDVAIVDKVLDAALALLLGLCRWNVKACYE